MHLGHGLAIPRSELLLLADLTQPIGPDTQQLLERLREAGRVLQLEPAPASLALVQRQGSTWAILTGVGLRTLRKRAEDEDRW